MTLTGGPGALCWTLVRALPDWNHAVLFVAGNRSTVPPALIREFGCPVEHDPGGVDRMIDQYRPRAILYHNSGPNQIRTGEFSTIYYQHSGFRAAVEARAKCDHVWTVSQYLARAVGLPPESVVYQPVPVPPGSCERSAAFTVGRLCTPHPRKWVPGEQLPLYERLAADHPDVRVEFVGCPPAMQGVLAEHCQGRAAFHPACWSARSHLWRWHAMLYHAHQPETYGRTVCEAQRAGCVPIVDAQGGFRDQVEDGISGVLCDHTEGFSRGIASVQSLFEEMSAAAQLLGDRRGSLGSWAARFEATVGCNESRQMRTIA